MPVLAALGVTPDGSTVLVALRLPASEAEVHWKALIEDFRGRGLATPELIVSHGHKGLALAMETWPRARVQRCIQHKIRNHLDHCPPHARKELKRGLEAHCVRG